MALEFLGEWPDAMEKRVVLKYLRKVIREPDVWEIRRATGTEKVLTAPQGTRPKSLEASLQVKQGQTANGPARYLYRNRTANSPLYASSSVAEIVVFVGITYADPKGMSAVIDRVQQAVTPKAWFMAREWDDTESEGPDGKGS